MAAENEDRDKNINEPAGHNIKKMDKARRRLPGVNFDEMNYEQRRTPYDSGSRNVDKKDNDQNERHSNP